MLDTKPADDDSSFKPIPADWKWTPGSSFRMRTPIPADEYALTVVKPVTFSELQKLVDNIIIPKRKELFKMWVEELQKRGLLDMESFKQAIERAKNGNGDS
jgi:hypothetical protein